MAKLGYKWYPKDWKTDEKVFSMRLELRGFYRELIDFAYENDNFFIINEKYWTRTLGITKTKLRILLSQLCAIKVLEVTGEMWHIPSVEKRMVFIRSGSLGGKGRGKGKDEGSPKPNDNQKKGKGKGNNKGNSKMSELIKNSNVLNCYYECIKFFPDHLVPTIGNPLMNWLDTIEKLNRIDKIPFGKIIEIVKLTREDAFWSKNFLSIPKLRKKDSSGVKYVVVFNEKFKSKTKNYSPMDLILQTVKNIEVNDG